MIGLRERTGTKEVALERQFDAFDFGLRVASPGIIQSFDAEKQTVTVQIAITERILCNDPSFIEKHGSNVGAEEIPLLVDVPICIPRAGGFALTVPVKAGDECLVVFSDTCFDAWYQSGGVQNQMSLRRHDLSDGFAILGVWSQPKVLPDYQTDRIQMRNDAGTNYIELSDDALTMNFGSNKIVIDETGITATGNVTLNNNLEVKGTTDLDDTTTIQEKDFLTHAHGSVQPGLGTSGGVV